MSSLVKKAGLLSGGLLK